MLEKVKIALRISHDYLNSDIEDSISAARLELKRAGVKAEMADSETDELICLAIKTFCLSIYSATDAIRKGYEESWKYQLDNLRKSSAYMAEVI